MSFRTLAVASLAVGMALALTLMSIADAVLFRPLPVPRPEEIIRVYSTSRFHAFGFVSYPDYEDFARSARTLSGIVAQTQLLVAVGGRSGEAPQVRLGLAVTADYFDVLGVPAALGRTFRAQEAREAVVVLADAFWRGHYAGDPGILEHTIELGGTSFTVIGIAPPGFGLDRYIHEDYYVPIGAYAAASFPGAANALTDRGKRYLSVYARRTASLPAVKAELGAIAAHLESEYPDTNHDQKALVLAERDARMQSEGTLPVLAWILSALATLALAIACANVSGLLLLKNEFRRGEIALKVALGAEPMHLLRESVAHGLGLALAGTTAALPIAWAALRVLARVLTLPTDLPLGLDTRLDARMMALAAIAAIAITLLCGAAPWSLTQSRVSSRVTASGKVRDALVLVQIALATALVASGMFLLDGLRSARKIDLGYRTDHVLVLTFDPAQLQLSETRTRAFYRELLERAGQIPGVRAAALAQSIPLGFTGAQKQVSLLAVDAQHMAIWMNTVTPGYFDLMRMPLLAGRGFTQEDTDSTVRVAVVNQAMARLWPRGQALEQTMNVNGEPTLVVGIVKTAKYSHIAEPPQPFFYLPYSQNYASRMTLHVETTGQPGNMAPAVLAAARAIDPAQPVNEVRPLERYFSEGALFGARIGVSITSAAGGCALLLALTGLYASVASAVNRRRREIGVRRALGATRWDVMRLVLTQTTKRTQAGILCGLALAAAAQRWIAQIVTQPTPPGLWSWVAPAMLVTAASLSACAIPAWRAAKVDPAVALRRE
jgi:putative ABC transport system permease protein